MSNLKKLKASQTLSDIAVLLQLKPATLAYILYKIPVADRYATFTIPKKSGGERKISAPNPELKYAQQKLSLLLQLCNEEIESARPPKKRTILSHGFVKNGSIITNAKSHRNKNFVFNIDLENFFGTINFGRVRGYFITNKNFELAPAIATVLAQIACHENALPQGSPCSPVISNLIGHILDIRLAKLAADMGCNYSRYADDITFSTNAMEFPQEIAKNIHENKWVVGDKVNSIIQKAGFTINPAKTRLQYKMSRQQVTGLVVNKKINVRREYKQIVRAMTHKLIRTGEFHQPHIINNDEASPCAGGLIGTIHQLQGKLTFINWVNEYNRDKNITEHRPNKLKHDQESLNSDEKVFRNFLLYKNFHAPEKPTIIVEGKTDIIYLRSAIRSLAKKFPSLIKINADGTKEIAVKFFKYSELTNRLLNLNGGTGQLGSLISGYQNLFNKFKAPTQFPVIIVTDNDSGAAPILTNLRKVKNNPSITGNDDHYHVARNLYAVLLKKTGSDIAMEDLFPAAVLSQTWSGKTFNKSNNDNTATQYGKNTFAENIVAKNQDSIDFSGFTDVLSRISVVIDSHK